jgi:exodeoxyribonuclease VII large subunit
VQQVARRSEALRERGRRLDAAAVARLTRSRNVLASRRAAERLERALTERFGVATRALEHRRERLVALSPDSVLSRGYSITQDAATGHVLRSAGETSAGRKLRIRLASGRVGAHVDEVEP